MFKKGTIAILFLLLLQPKSWAQEEESQKSWGFGVIGLTSSIFNDELGLNIFYQKNRHQFNLNFYSGTEFLYSYYPNPWKEKFNVNAQALLGGFKWQFSNYGDSWVIYSGVGYGLRLKVLKHFYLTHSGHLLLCRRKYYDFLRERWNNFDTEVDFRLSIQFNLGSLKWKRK